MPEMRPPTFDDSPCKRLKNQCLRSCNWNIQSLHCAAAKMIDIPVGLKAYITIVHEVQLKRLGRNRVVFCDIY